METRRPQLEADIADTQSPQPNLTARQLGVIAGIKRPQLLEDLALSFEHPEGMDT
ncbi:hypothetical protein HOE49_04320 [Candidatus Peregrinibacteria bacterium]|jgi:hypothetical protein|nr:hypothetical protein [Candidatus Peregrinibacteria bacterium]MBT4148473.1 hypothetical protein [Candidatus Peregrinibacteria bacterium]